ncbi:hypothetical protein ACT17_32700 [Mycolicibacterium conceptionense]|uniref:Uncharacterized protein n=1 Tax=Mycolicibacterium conceptionense TaxID=451644 RepID=A0A0J8TXP9_9MYCO|nr:hypothetical protein [Mycolicibacterium conceptionense]KMV13942.1 hypothetical protein ACT17_32700 [Mycolicibacterium conceptionense]
MSIRYATRIVTRSAWRHLTAPRGWVFLAINYGAGTARVAESRWWIRTRLAKTLTRIEMRGRTGTWTLVGPFRREHREKVLDRYGVQIRSTTPSLDKEGSHG